MVIDDAITHTHTTRRQANGLSVPTDTPSPVLTVRRHGSVDGVEGGVRVDKADGGGHTVVGVVAGIAGHEILVPTLEAVLVKQTRDTGRHHGPPVVVCAVPYARQQGNLYVTCARMGNPMQSRFTQLHKGSPGEKRTLSDLA